MILYATIFSTLMLVIAGTRIFLWQTRDRPRIERELKRLELRIAELAQSLAGRTEED